MKFELRKLLGTSCKASACKRLAWRFTAAVLLVTPLSAFATTCVIYDMSSLQACFNQSPAADTYDFQGDVSCSGADCCAASGAPLISLDGRSGVTIQGNGHRITRYGNQKICPAITMYSASNIGIYALNIDEDEATSRCLGYEVCPATIDASGSTGITLEGVGVYNAKAIAIGINSTDGYVLNNSTISNTGVIGVYAGSSSTHVSITNSVIARSGANGVAFQTVTGAAGTIQNHISNNVIDTNHYAGAYYEGWEPYFNNGGQIYLPDSQSVSVDHNIIADGRCDSCRGYGPGGPAGGGISAFEITGSVGSLNFHANKIRNLDGPVFFVNDAGVFSDTAVWENESAGALSWLYVRNGVFWPNEGVNPFGNYTPTANSQGYLSSTIFRLYSAGFHQEANWRYQHGTGAIHENTFHLASHPLPGGASKPIYRCLIWHTTSNDFPSLDSNCESSSFFLHGILGYSFPPTYPGAQPFYRCLVNSSATDHFVSWDPNCEGQFVSGLLGYAIP